MACRFSDVAVLSMCMQQVERCQPSAQHLRLGMVEKIDWILADCKTTFDHAMQSDDLDGRVFAELDMQFKDIFDYRSARHTARTASMRCGGQKQVWMPRCRSERKESVCFID